METGIFNERSMKSLLHTKRIGSRLFCLSQVDSTNEELKRRFMADEGLPDGAVAVTSDQTAGKGRRGRGWETPPGVNIAMSVFLRPKLMVDEASMLTLLMALAVSRACSEVTGQKCLIKWPNDVIVDGKKICGILTEMSVRDGGIEYVIVGVGVNVNTPAFDGELFDKATSLMLMTGRSFDLCELAALIMDHFETLYETFLNRRDLGFIRDEYDSLLVSRGKKVRILDPKGDLEGVSLGINDRGELLVELSDGSVRNIYAGEVSVRGVYGYV